MKALFIENRTRYNTFYEAAKAAHTTSLREHRGHGFDHDVSVAQMSAYIAPDEGTATTAWLASLLHSIDRIVDKDSVESATRSIASNLEHLMSPADIEEIVQSALRHSELNQDDQSLTQQCLQDSDRLINLQSAVIIRAGQFQPTIPALELTHLTSVNPASTYRDPKSVLDNLRLILSEYLPQLRMPKAVALSAGYETRLQVYIESIRNDYDELGLLEITL